MDKTYDAAQQGLMANLVGIDHEANLARFLNGLRNDPHWTPAQVDEVEQRILVVLGVMQNDKPAIIPFRSKTGQN